MWPRDAVGDGPRCCKHPRLRRHDENLLKPVDYQNEPTSASHRNCMTLLTPKATPKSVAGGGMFVPHTREPPGPGRSPRYPREESATGEGDRTHETDRIRAGDLWAFETNHRAA